MLSAVVIALILIVSCGAVHYAFMRGLDLTFKASRLGKGLKLQISLLIAVIVHSFEAGLYAIGFQFSHSLNLGGFKGLESPHSIMDVFYFSLVNYTSLGLGDIYPTGHLRFLAGIESLNGFLLISCSAALLFRIMSPSKSF